MARINTLTLSLQVTDAVFRAEQVRRDPAVVKSAGAFGADLRQAARSGGELIHEVRSAWIRTDGRGTPTSSPAVA